MGLVIKPTLLSSETLATLDGRPLPTRKQRLTSGKACAPHLLHASRAPHFDLPVILSQFRAGRERERERELLFKSMIITAFMLFRFFAHTPVFSAPG